METKFASSELVLAEDNTPYHIRIKPETLADKVILVGDPARAELISKRFDKISAHTSNREIVSYSGTYKSKPLTVLSTGMGVGCIDIVINELDICANVNLETKQPNPSHRSLDLIRIGTCGSLQDELEVGMCVASAFAILFPFVILTAKFENTSGTSSNCFLPDTEYCFNNDIITP